MAPPSKIKNVDEVRRWYEEGKTYQEMSDLHFEKYGVRVAPTSFSALRSRMGWEGRVLVDNPLIPWHVRPEHRGAYAYRMLNREGRRRAGLPQLTQEPESRLDSWIEGLKSQGAVVEYRPNTKEGFFLVYAREGVDNDLIREPDTP